MAQPLTREEFLRLTRGDDPLRCPMWNGPPRATTPPQHPVRPMSNEGQLFEFLLPYPINIFDDADWLPLYIERGKVRLNLLKPATYNVSSKEAFASGNEAPDLFVTNVRVFVERSAPGYPVKHVDVFPIVRESLQWIRVLSRQYWIGTGTAGVAAAYRGSSFRVEPPTVAQSNYAGYGQTVLVRALKIDSWCLVGECVQQEVPVPPAEAIFCDALSSFVAGDMVRSIVELGVAAEIELTNLLDDIAAKRPNDSGSKQYLKLRRQHRDRFQTKLIDCSKALGLDDPASYGPPRMPLDWANLVQQLYRCRNKAAHEGRCLIEDRATGKTRQLNESELGSFVFATETLFHWSRSQRAKHGLATVDASRRTDQIIAIQQVNDGRGLVMETSESVATI